MNGICAGGTGSFIDQMASLLQTDATGLNEYAKNYTALYDIAARCGVFIRQTFSLSSTMEPRRPGCFHFPGGGQSDHQWTGMWKLIRGTSHFWAVRFISFLSSEAFISDSDLDDEHTIADKKLPPLLRRWDLR